MVKKNNLKALAFLVISGLSVYFLNYCTEDKEHARSYPRLKTNPVSGITGNGATFNGEIYSLGTEPILDHGFVWGHTDIPTLGINKTVLGPCSTAGPYSYDIVSSLAKDVEYTVWSFVQTADHIVYGTSVKFTSLGSGAPSITGFEPHSAAWNDTLRISGKNFSGNASQNIVKLNNIACNVLLATDTSIYAVVNPKVSDPENIVSVELAGNLARYSTDTFRLIPPVIKDYSPKKVLWGDTLLIKGEHFRTFISVPANKVSLGSFKCKVTGTVTDSSISAIVPDELNTKLSDLSMNINGLVIKASQQIELLPAYFTISPTTATWGSTVTLTGRFNNLLQRTSILFNSTAAEILTVGRSTIKIKVPSTLSDSKSLVFYNVDPFSVKAADTFRLADPVIYSFTPVSGPSGTIVTIKGKYFDMLSTAVRFGTEPAYISGRNDSVLVVIVPNGIDGQVRISVESRSATVVSSDYFDVTNPRISSISTFSGTFGDMVTITGRGFVSPLGPTYVSFGGIDAEIRSISGTSMVIAVPNTLDSIPRTIQLTSGNVTVYSALKFVLTPPQIVSVTSGGFVPGQDLTITGNGFNPIAALNYVYWDIYALTVKSSSPTEIIASWPQVLPTGSHGIKVTTGGYSCLSAQTFSSSSAWMRISSPEIPTTSPWAYYTGLSNYGKSLNNHGYVCSEVSGETYRFDPAGKSWTKLNIPSPFYTGMPVVKMGEVVCRDTFYLLGGHFTNYTMKAFDEAGGVWRTLSSPGQISGVAFSIHDYIYYGLDFYSPGYNVMKICDPANHYSWLTEGSFPLSEISGYSAYFTVGSRGYVVFSDNSVWQFNPDVAQDQWTRVADFPGSARVFAFSFVLGDKGYFGGGKAPDYAGPEYNDLWMYDPASDTWTLVSYIPLARHSAVAFSIGTKAYIGYGLKQGPGFPVNLFDFYEFDPNYIAK